VTARQLTPQGEAAADSMSRRRVDSGKRCNVVAVNEIPRAGVEWLWPGRLPLGKVVLLEGDPDVGKSTIAAEITARVSAGRSMPDGVTGRGASSVLWLSGEDGISDTLRPRLEAAGAALDRVFVLRAVEREKRDGTIESAIPLIPDDLYLIEQAVADCAVSLLVIDVLNVFLSPRINSWSDHDVRRALQPLNAMAERTGTCVLALRHLKKGAESKALYKGGGSIGIIGAARAALLLAMDPDDPSGKRRVLATTKSNLATKPAALALTLESDETFGCALVRWHGAVRFTADDLVAGKRSSSAVAVAEEFLRGLLSESERLTNEVKVAADEAGVSWAAVRRAKGRLGVEARKDADAWWWRLPRDVEDGMTTEHVERLEHLEPLEAGGTDDQEPAQPAQPAQPVQPALPGDRGHRHRAESGSVAAEGGCGTDADPISLLITTFTSTDGSQPVDATLYHCPACGRPVSPSPTSVSRRWHTHCAPCDRRLHPTLFEPVNLGGEQTEATTGAPTPRSACT
jgi:hypothetical protein